MLALPLSTFLRRNPPPLADTPRKMPCLPPRRTMSVQPSLTIPMRFRPVQIATFDGRQQGRPITRHRLSRINRLHVSIPSLFQVS